MKSKGSRHFETRITLAAAFIALSACGGQQQKVFEQPKNVSPTVSKLSQDLSRYYGELERRLILRGLMRTDRGGPDTPFTKEDLIRDFQALAFYGEYVSGHGFTKAIAQPTELSKWEDPVRVRLLFGPSVSAKTRESDRQTVTELLDRLTNVTRHPIMLVEDNSNFDVLVANEDERYDILTQLQHQRHPIGHHAVIRAEHPPLLRKACFHEEIAQGLGLSNDSPKARPSIFNDDDEFALLTEYDEILLNILYDSRLRSGMSLNTAAPVLRQIINERYP
ncbi:MAG: DUF2927 domain-containing protein [Rhodobacteraceae bacterium]|nr:DUF2927 domain-containing protein [Paracoccaceae bacterium]